MHKPQTTQTTELVLIGRLRPGRWESTVETTDAGWADYPMISTEQCPRLSIERRKHHAVRQRGGISFRFTSVTFSTARGSRSRSRVLFP